MKPLILSVLVVGITSCASAPSVSTDVDAKPSLLLLPIQVQKHHGTIWIEGQVKNISTENLETIFPVADFYDASGALVQSSTGQMTYDPIMPGQTSPFKIAADDNPLIQRIEISGFKTPWGARISHTTNW